MHPSHPSYPSHPSHPIHPSHPSHPSQNVASDVPCCAPPSLPGEGPLRWGRRVSAAGPGRLGTSGPSRSYRRRWWRWPPSSLSLFHTRTRTEMNTARRPARGRRGLNRLRVAAPLAPPRPPLRPNTTTHHPLPLPIWPLPSEPPPPPAPPGPQTIGVPLRTPPPPAAAAPTHPRKRACGTPRAASHTVSVATSHTHIGRNRPHLPPSHAHAHTCTHARAHARARAHTHTHIRTWSRASISSTRSTLFCAALAGTPSLWGPHALKPL